MHFLFPFSRSSCSTSSTTADEEDDYAKSEAGDDDDNRCCSEAEGPNGASGTGHPPAYDDIVDHAVDDDDELKLIVHI